jgi:hypothetical protein
LLHIIELKGSRHIFQKLQTSKVDLAHDDLEKFENLDVEHGVS